jgi:transcriptional regulator with XRE-family HTH domain
MIRPPSPLELARRAQGLTQSELADRAGVSRNLIAQAQHGYVPSLESQQRIADALGIDVAGLWPAQTAA